MGICDINITAALDDVAVGNVLARIRPNPAEVWGFGLLCVTVISSCSAIGIGILPFLSKRVYFKVLTYMIGLGVGSLSGGAIFHLIPQSLLSPSDQSNHDYLVKSWLAVFGVYLFFIADRLLKFIMEYRKRKRDRIQQRLFDEANLTESPREKTVVTFAGQSDSTDPVLGISVDSQLLDRSNSTKLTKDLVIAVHNLNGSTKDPVIRSLSNCSSLPRSETQSHRVRNYSSCERLSTAAIEDFIEEEEIRKMTHAHEAEAKLHVKKGENIIAAVAWMVIFGDGLHKVIDGLSIGAAFSESIAAGVSVSVAVLCEEFPHELGDVAILLSAGMSWRQALLYNILSASTCYLGFVVGVLAGELASASVYIFPLAGGMFLYISLATMIPEMNESAEKIQKTDLTKGLYMLALQSSGIISGLLIMFLMAFYGSQISFNT